MPSIHRLIFYTFASALILSLFCLLPAQTTSASRTPTGAQYLGDPRHDYKDGINALDGANYEKAAEYFKQAAANKPDDIWAFYYFGLSLHKLKQYGEAANAYRQALAINPNKAEVHYQFSKICLEMGDRETAEKERLWLQENDKELALYLSDPLPSNTPATQHIQKTPDSSANDKPAIDPMTANLKPTILYREKAKYTEIARTNRTYGTVVLQIVFDRNGSLHSMRVLRGLPDGLTHKAIEAAQKLRFKPATMNGEPVSVRGALEFTFNLY